MWAKCRHESSPHRIRRRTRAAHPAASFAQTHAAAEAQTLDLAKETIALRSVRGPGNRAGDVAQVFRRALLAGGWADGDIEIVPVDDTAYLIATWPGAIPRSRRW
jgi:hypothetical protein